MTEPVRYERGDVVQHALRPEWGNGTVANVTSITHEGVRAQRLDIRFSNKGQVTVNTAVAKLTCKEKAPAQIEPQPKQKSNGNNDMSRTQSTPSFSPTQSGQGWLGSIAANKKEEKQEHELWSLPDEMTDPFMSISKRLEATLESFKYTKDPRGVMDWAVLQTGLDDPMSKYTRHELEMGFDRFGVERERHLKSLIRQLKAKGEMDVVKEIRRWLVIPTAVSALDKTMNQL